MSAQRGFHGLLIIVAALILGFSLLVYSAYAVNLMNFPYDYDQGEGFELVDTVLFSQFQWPYRDTEDYPFYSSNYPPLFHMLAAPFVWFFGPAYWYGRLLGFLATLLTAGAIAYAVYREGRLRWIAIFSGLAFLASNTVYHIGPLFRQHATMVAFETLAVVILAMAIPKRQTRHIALGLGLLIAAGYTKQLAAITAIAVLVWFFVRTPQRSLTWGVSFALTGLAIFAGLTFATDGEWWRQTVVANVNEFNPYQAFGLYLLWFQLHGFLIVPALALVIYQLYAERLSLYAVWFVVAVLLGGIGSGTWGAGDSYFATAIAATCILSGIAFSRVSALGRHTRIAQVAMILVPVFFIGYGIATFKMPTQGAVFGPIADLLHLEPNVMNRHYDSASYAVEGYANIGHFVTEADHAAAQAILDAINAIPPDIPVLSEEAGFSFATGRDVITNPTQLLNLWRAGLFDGQNLIDLIEDRAFGLVILRAQFYPTPVLETLGQHYQIEQTVQMNGFDYLLLTPAPA